MPKLLPAKSIGSLDCHNINSYETMNSLASLSHANCASFVTVPDLSDHCSPEFLQSTKRHREKNNVVKEMLSSEKKYIGDIREIVEGYYDEIANVYGDNQEFIYHIFSNIRDIFEFTK